MSLKFEIAGWCKYGLDYTGSWFIPQVGGIEEMENSLR